MPVQRRRRNTGSVRVRVQDPRLRAGGAILRNWGLRVQRATTASAAARRPYVAVTRASPSCRGCRCRLPLAGGALRSWPSARRLSFMRRLRADRPPSLRRSRATAPPPLTNAEWDAIILSVPGVLAVAFSTCCGIVLCRRKKELLQLQAEMERVRGAAWVRCRGLACHAGSRLERGLAACLATAVQRAAQNGTGAGPAGPTIERNRLAHVAAPLLHDAPKTSGTLPGACLRAEVPGCRACVRCTSPLLVEPGSLTGVPLSPCVPLTRAKHQRARQHRVAACPHPRDRAQLL